LTEWQGKLRSRKEANEVRVGKMREGREEQEYQKGNAIAMHEARIKNMDS